MPKLIPEGSTGQSAEEILAATKAAGTEAETHEESIEDTGPTEEEQEVVKAEKQGWRPLEEWDGDPDDWVDAKTFNQRGDKIAGIATERSKRQQKRIEMLEAQLLTVNDNYAKINARERAQAKATAEVLNQRIAQLEAQKEDAMNASDAVGAMRIDKQIQEITERKDAAEEVVKATTPVAHQGGGNLPPEAAAWRTKNAWFGPDVEATIYANGMGTFYKQNVNPNGSIAEMLEYVDKKVAQRFPEYGEKKTMTRKPAGPEGGNSGMRNSGAGRKNAETGGMTYADLPPEAKQICDSLCKTIKGYTREKYIAKYSQSK